MKENLVKRWYQSIFIKILIAFFVIIMLMFGGSFWFYIRAQETMREQITRMTLNQMDSSMTLFDEQTQLLINWGQYLCVSNDSLSQLAGIPDALDAKERNKMLNELKVKFSEIGLVANLVEDVRLHLYKAKITVRKNMAHSAMDQEEYNYINTNFTLGNAWMLYNGKPLLVTNATYYFVIRQEEMIPYYLVIELSRDKIRESLTGNHGSGKYENTVICSEDGSSIFTEDDNDLTREIIRVSMAEPDKEQITYKADGTEYLIIKEQSRLTGLYLIKYVSYQEMFRDLQVYKIWLLIFILISCFALVFFSFIVYYHVHKPLSRLVNAFKKIENGDFDVGIDYKKVGEFGYLYSSFNRMAGRLKQLIEQVYEKTILSQKAELIGLQSQIDPHFFYNSMFLVSVSAKQGDMEFVEKFTEQLGKYFRFLHRNDRENITLSEETEYAALYADIQATRFVNRVKVEVNEPPQEYRDFPVPRLIIQPLIENAFKHCLEKSASGGTLRVCFKGDGGDFLYIIVENTGDDITDEVFHKIQTKLSSVEHGGTRSGISNIHRRLQLQFGEDSGLTAERPPEGGLRMIMKIKVRNHV